MTTDHVKCVTHLNVVVQILLLDGVQEGVEPLRRPEIADDPDEVHLGQSRRLVGVRPVSSVPDVFQDTSEWCDTDTGSHEHSDFVLSDVMSNRRM